MVQPSGKGGSGLKRISRAKHRLHIQRLIPRGDSHTPRLFIGIHDPIDSELLFGEEMNLKSTSGSEPAQIGRGQVARVTDQ